MNKIRRGWILGMAMLGIFFVSQIAIYASVNAGISSPFDEVAIKEFLDAMAWKENKKDSFFWLEQMNDEDIYFTYQKQGLGFALFYLDYSKYDEDIPFGQYSFSFEMFSPKEPFYMKNIQTEEIFLGNQKVEMFKGTIDPDNTSSPRLKEDLGQETRLIGIAIPWKKFVFVSHFTGPIVDGQMEGEEEIEEIIELLRPNFSKVEQAYLPISEKSEETEEEEIQVQGKLHITEELIQEVIKILKERGYSITPLSEPGERTEIEERVERSQRIIEELSSLP